MKLLSRLRSAPCLARTLLWIVPLAGVYFVVGVFGEVQGALAASIRLLVPALAGALVALACLADFLFARFLSKDSRHRLVHALHGTFVVVVLGLIANELYLQSMGAGGASWAHMHAKTQPPKYQGALAFNEDLGWIGKPNYIGRRRIEGSEQHIRFAFNADGYRDIEISGQDSRPLLIVIGDSLSTALDVEMEDGIVSRLRDYLPEYQVVNLAVTAYSLDQVYLKFKALDLAREPDVVLCLMHWEVGADRSRAAEFGRLKPFFNTDKEGLVLRNESVHLATSNLEVQLALAPAEFERISSIASAARFLGREYFPRRVQSLSQYRRFRKRPQTPTPVSQMLLNEMDSLSRQAGAEIHFAFIPGKGSFKRGAARTLRPVYGTLESLGLSYLDGHSALQPEWQSLFTTGGHLNKEGNDRAARSFASQLQQIDLETKAGRGAREQSL